MEKVWAYYQTAIDPTNEVVFPKAPPSVGETTVNIAESWGPFDWLRLVSTEGATVNVRIYMRENPNWYDIGGGSVFADQYVVQYNTVQLKSATGRESSICVVGEIWGWNVRTVPTGGLHFFGGTGRPPAS